MGSVHSCFLSRDGSLFTCGKHEYNGHGLKADLLAPRPLPPVFFGVATPRVTQLSVNPGGYHTIALTHSGEVYTWGHNRCGQLGYYSTSLHGDVAADVSPSGPLPRNFEGALFSPTPRRVFLRSSASESDSVGVGVTNGIKANAAEVVQVSAGSGHSSVLLRDGSVFMCGLNQHGQLGCGSHEACRFNERGHLFQDRFQLVAKASGAAAAVARAVVCGAEHSLLICDNNNNNNNNNIGIYSAGKCGASQLAGRDAFPLCESFSRLDLGRHLDGRHVRQVACGSDCSFVLLHYQQEEQQDQHREAQQKEQQEQQQEQQHEQQHEQQQEEQQEAQQQEEQQQEEQQQEEQQQEAQQQEAEQQEAQQQEQQQHEAQQHEQQQEAQQQEEQQEAQQQEEQQEAQQQEAQKPEQQQEEQQQKEEQQEEAQQQQEAKRERFK